MVLHTCSINLCQRGIETGFFLLSFFKNILSENIFFAKNYQENTTVCLLQPKVVVVIVVVKSGSFSSCRAERT